MSAVPDRDPSESGSSNVTPHPSSNPAFEDYNAELQVVIEAEQGQTDHGSIEIPRAMEPPRFGDRRIDQMMADFHAAEHSSTGILEVQIMHPPRYGTGPSKSSVALSRLYLAFDKPSLAVKELPKLPEELRRSFPDIWIWKWDEEFLGRPHKRAEFWQSLSLLPNLRRVYFVALTPNGHDFDKKAPPILARDEDWHISYFYEHNRQAMLQLLQDIAADHGWDSTLFRNRPSNALAITAADDTSAHDSGESGDEPLWMYRFAANYVPCSDERPFQHWHVNKGPFNWTAQKELITRNVVQLETRFLKGMKAIQRSPMTSREIFAGWREDWRTIGRPGT